MSIEAPKPFQEKRPWGEEIWISRNGFSNKSQLPPPSMIKIITVYPGESLSLQYHHNRDEYWRVISGNGMAEIGEEKIALNAGFDVDIKDGLKNVTDCFILRETKHRLHGGTENLVLLELAFGDFDETDIVRLEDKYGRK